MIRTLDTERIACGRIEEKVIGELRILFLDFRNAIRTSIVSVKFRFLQLKTSKIVLKIEPAGIGLKIFSEILE
jgi:hypothetical protein